MPHVGWTDLIAAYAAIVSTIAALIGAYQAFRWAIEARPYYTFLQPQARRPADSVLVRVHNPGRKMIFIVGDQIKVIRSHGEERLVRVTPRGRPLNGFTAEYGAHLMAGRLLLAIAPNNHAELSIGPVYPEINLIVTLYWHRGRTRKGFWPRALLDLFNSLKIPVTPEIEELIAKSRTDLDVSL